MKTEYILGLFKIYPTPISILADVLKILKKIHYVV